MQQWCASAPSPCPLHLAHTSTPAPSLSPCYLAGKLGTTALAALGSNGALFSVLYFLCFTALAVLCTQVRLVVGIVWVVHVRWQRAGALALEQLLH